MRDWCGCVCVGVIGLCVNEDRYFGFLVYVHVLFAVKVDGMCLFMEGHVCVCVYCGE